MSAAITRSHLANKLHKSIGYSKTDSTNLVNSVFEEIKQSLKNDEEVKITSFGTFKCRKKKERVGRNPKTKEEVVVSARNVVNFYASNLLKDNINQSSAKKQPANTMAEENIGIKIKEEIL